MARLLQKSLPGYAALLLAQLAAAWVAVGCVTTPPMEEEPVSEHAPTIDLELVIPDSIFVQRVLTTNPLIEFSAEGAVHDVDGDSTYTYWYLLHEEGEEKQKPVSSRATYTYVPCADSVRPPPDPNPQTQQAFAFMQLDVADRARLKNPDGEELEEPRTYPEGAHVQTLTWVLLFSGTCPPRSSN